MLSEKFSKNNFQKILFRKHCSVFIFYFSKMRLVTENSFLVLRKQKIENLIDDYVFQIQIHKISNLLICSGDMIIKIG